MFKSKKNEFPCVNEKIYKELLKDRTTNKNICWATEIYTKYGDSYYPQEPITVDLLYRRNKKVVEPRIKKSKLEQKKRTKSSAEVFTPSWMCNEQNNLVDEKWFGRENVFNISRDKEWSAIKEKVEFPKEKDWKNYVSAVRLEVSCGEAPYLVSRYDTVSGQDIPIGQRIGLLDRKLRVVLENTTTEEEWFKWVIKAYESIYGFEYQGDNLLIARENLLYTFIEYTREKFKHDPSEEQIKKIVKIISWNMWQMDGIKMTAPFSERERVNTQISFFEEFIPKEPIPCTIYDWKEKKVIEFKSMVNGGV